MCQEDTDQSPKKKSHELEIKMEADNPTSWGVIVAILIFVALAGLISFLVV